MFVLLTSILIRSILKFSDMHISYEIYSLQRKLYSQYISGIEIMMCNKITF